MRSRGHAARRRRRRRNWWLLAATLLLLTAWLGVRGYQVRTHLLAARADLARLSLAQVAALPEAIPGAQREVAAAKAATDDPVWRLASLIPFAGRSFAVARDATAASTVLVEEVLPTAGRAGQRLRGSKLLTGGVVDLQLLRALEPDIAEAAASAAKAEAITAASPGGLLPGPIQQMRADLVGQTQSLNAGLAAARTAVTLAPGMLGADGPRRYFVAVQNNAEARGTGGLVGAYLVLRADGGRLSRERVGTNREFQTAAAPVAQLGPEYSARYDPEGGRVFWSSAVLTPDWSSAAAVMAGLWQAQGGGKIDGVIGVDPLSMAQLLAVTGPATVGGRQIGADNVVDFVMRDEYAQFPTDDQARKDLLKDLAAALYDRVVVGDYSSIDMLQALAKAGGSGHLQVWSAVPGEEQRLTFLRVSGALPQRPGAFLEVVTNNASGNKTDYYLRRRVSYERNGDGTARVQVQLTNLVNPSAVPPVVIGRLDNPRTPTEPGATRVIVSLFVGLGEQVKSVQVNGQPVVAQFGSEGGHGAVTLQVEVAPSDPTVITAEVGDPGGELLYRQQPLVVSDSLDMKVPFGLE